MRHRFSALVEATQTGSLAEALLRTGGVVKARIQRDVFDVEGPGWAPLAPSTMKRKINEPMLSLIRGTVHSASSKFNNQKSVAHYIVREAEAATKASGRISVLKARIDARRAKGKDTSAMERSLLSQTRRLTKAVDYIRSKRHAAIASGIGANRLIEFARREVARSKKHGEALRYLKRKQAAMRQVGMTMSIEEQRRLGRIGKRRYNASEASTRILGGLRESITMKLIGNRIEVFSKAHIGAIHNFGGTAGHGAQIKARKFMDLASSDLDFLAGLLREKMIAAWHSTDGDAPASHDFAAQESA
jgi:phage gpG-like protein